MSIVINPSGRYECRGCDKVVGHEVKFGGPGCWYPMSPACGHEQFFVCPDCMGRKGVCSCPKCGYQEILC